jgi:hypothetical protein
MVQKIGQAKHLGLCLQPIVQCLTVHTRRADKLGTGFLLATVVAQPGRTARRPPEIEAPELNYCC